MIKRELPLDILEFFCLTPLPGSEDHQKLWRAGVEMHPDLNRYDLEHVCAPHPKMSQAEWEAIYLEAWSIYYSKEHMRTLLRRGFVTGLPIHSLVKLLLTFATTIPIERVHPIQGGILRLKHPSELRPGLKRPNPVLFWPGFAWEHAAQACCDPPLPGLAAADGARDQARPGGERLHRPRPHLGRAGGGSQARAAGAGRQAPSRLTAGPCRV